MTGWSILAHVAVCSAGVLLFLRLVVDAIAGAREGMRVFESSVKKAPRRRLDDDPYVAGSSVDVAADSPEAAVGAVEEAA